MLLKNNVLVKAFILNSVKDTHKNMANCFHIALLGKEKKPCVFKYIPLIGSIRKNGSLERGDSVFLEDVVISESREIKRLINDPDGYHVKCGRHCQDGLLMDETIYLDHIVLGRYGSVAERYHLDLEENPSEQIYLLYCPKTEYRGQKVFKLNPGEKVEIFHSGNLIKAAYEDGKISLNGERGIDVFYDHTWPEKMRIFA